MCSSQSNEKIMIRYKEQNLMDSIDVEVDGKEEFSKVKLHNGSIVVEGKKIRVKSTSLPVGKRLTLEFEILGQEQYEFRWEVLDGTEHKIYVGTTGQRILIQGPDTPKNKDKKSKAETQDEIIISTSAWGESTESLTPGTSMLVNGSWIAIKAAAAPSNPWITGKYTLLK